MDAAEEFIHVAVMDYAPQTMFTRRQQFWYIRIDTGRFICPKTRVGLT